MKKRQIAITATDVALAMGLIAAPAAQAHDALTGTQPTSGETVQEVSEVSLTFSNTLLDMKGIGTAFVIQVEDEQGLYYGDGCVSLSDATMSMPVTLGEEGDYTVTWRAVSTDGHAISDAFTFSYRPPAGTVAAEGTATALRCERKSRPPPKKREAQGKKPGVAKSGLIVGLGIGGLILAAGVIGLIFASRKMNRS